jgi:hypothetical protein
LELNFLVPKVWVSNHFALSLSLVVTVLPETGLFVLL